MNPPRAQAGFTLLEVLIALAIVRIALAASIRALGISAGGAHAMQQRSPALQAAENNLAELRLQRAFPVVGRTTVPCPQGPLARSASSRSNPPSTATSGRSLCGRAWRRARCLRS